MLDYPAWASATAVAALIVGLIGGALVLLSKARRAWLKTGAYLVAFALLVSAIAGGGVYMAVSARQAEIYERVYPLSERTGSRRSS